MLTNNKIDSSLLQYICNILADTVKGVTGSTIINQSNKYAVKYDVSIPNAKYPSEKNKNKRTMLFENLECFNIKQQLEIIEVLCDMNRNNPEINDVLLKIRPLKENDSLQQELISDTNNALSDFEKAQKVYNESLKKYNSGIYDRNVVDDMRLSLELLVKAILNNDRSLENQTELIGEYLKENGVSKEIRNIYTTNLRDYIKYMNENAKHNDQVHYYEVDFVIELTSVLIKFLIKTEKNRLKNRQL